MAERRAFNVMTMLSATYQSSKASQRAKRQLWVMLKKVKKCCAGNHYLVQCMLCAMHFQFQSKGGGGSGQFHDLEFQPP